MFKKAIGTSRGRYMVERHAARVRRRGLTFRCADPFASILRRSPSRSRKPLCILQQADGKKSNFCFVQALRQVRSAQHVMVSWKARERSA